MDFKTEQKLIIKVDHQGIKLKFQVQSLSITFFQLKEILCQKYNESGLNLDPLNLQCADADEFKFADDEIIVNYLKENDLIKLLINDKKILASEQEQQVKIQFLNQQPSQNSESSKNSDLIQDQIFCADADKEMENVKEESKQQNVVNPPDELIQKILDEKAEEEELMKKFELMKSGPKDDPTEAIVVIFDTSGSMKSSFSNDKLISRMGAVNGFFSAFADKTLAFEYNHLVKLVCFASSIVDKCDFMDDFNKFIQLVDGSNPGGGTKCYDALAYAVMSLIQIKKKFPGIILRIIALTDGEDNESKSTPQEVANLIRKNKIILDSFVVGSNCGGLKQITHASGGKCYCPQDMNSAFQLFEIETILSVRDRPRLEEQSTEPVELSQFAQMPFDTDGIVVSKPDSLSKGAVSMDKFMEKQKAMANAPKSSAVSSSSQSTVVSSGSGGREKRILREMNSINNQEKKYSIYPQQNDIATWKVLIKGPIGSLYEGGIFIVLIVMPNDYPFKPPSVRFDTQIYHCNINTSGRVCLDLLKDQWSPSISIQKVIDSLIELLGDPNPNDALDSTIATMMKCEPEQYKINVKLSLDKNAHESVEFLVEQMTGLLKENPEFQVKRQEIQKWMDEPL